MERAAYLYAMIDINGNLIEVGDWVSTQQPSGGILPPAPAQIGVVEETLDAFKRETLQIRYRREGQDFDRFILLDGKINELILA